MTISDYEPFFNAIEYLCDIKFINFEMVRSNCNGKFESKSGMIFDILLVESELKSSIVDVAISNSHEFNILKLKEI